MPAATSRTRRFHRRSEGRVIAGVATGIGEQLGIDPNLVRVVLVVLTLAGGIGVFAYGAAWVLLPVDDDPAPFVSRSGGVVDRDVDLVRGVASGAIVLGVALLARRISPWLPERLLWPGVLVATGMAMVWRRDPTRRSGDLLAQISSRSIRTPSDLAAVVTVAVSGSSRRSAMRIAAGGVLVILGVGTFVAANGSFGALRQGLLAGLVLALGLALILGPWLVRLTTDLATERRARIRSEAQADFAAHIHDSVLQTLAIIQRRADQPREVMTLARRQERELRAWLYGGGAGGAGLRAATLGEAIEAAADEVEALHGVRIDVVKVGDCPMDDAANAVTLAAREAMVNAAKHAGVDEISVFAEVVGRDVSVFVRDRGSGFDPAAVAEDRRGVSDSIRARMERVGGRATVSSTAGEGTEVELTIALARSDA
jgi:signal transduction histidine kinase/phage shock protein PspC (stress-responsive transcriptional regulator)